MVTTEMCRWSIGECKLRLQLLVWCVYVCVSMLPKRIKFGAKIINIEWWEDFVSLTLLCLSPVFEWSCVGVLNYFIIFFILWRDFFFTSYIFAMALLRLVTQCFVCYNLKEEHTHTNTHTSIFELIDLLNIYTRSRLPITIRFDRIEVIV